MKTAHIKYLSIKLVFFTALAIFVFAFRDQHVENLKPFIGSLMLLYGVDGIAYEILLYGKAFFKSSKAYLVIIDIAFGIVLIAAPVPFEHVCVIWATWSIVRESYEIKEIVCDLKMLVPKLLSGAESIVVFVFSVMLILDPGEHHSLIHMGLLTAELILNPLILLIDEFLIRWKQKKADMKENVQKEGDFAAITNETKE